ncbi:MAG: hypothetical protein Q8922_10305 [Bacteroidota bacterium]|nr:hypothetical protein [Bacteroidota bacterium]MDP4233912.1 hypothetical protein [Bacteroidota bacterium]MDP4242838.1 hypothetical protein [Bacteroidota bacterium]MDP4288316.1 hypothetical protein [Bacteroidota bacterium]
MKILVTMLFFTSILVLASPVSAMITFTVQNQQTESLGTVTVSCVDGDFYVTVAGSSSASVDIPDSATSITICGTMVPVGQKTELHLASGKLVEVLWSGAAPTIIDPDEILMRDSETSTSHLLAELRARAGDWALAHREFYATA